MARIGEADDAGRGVDDEIDGGDEHRGRQVLEEMMEPLVELAQERTGIVRDAVDFLHQHALDGSHQRGRDAMPHDVADEHAGLRVGDLVDGEKVAAHAPLGQVTVGEAERAFGFLHRARKRRVALGQQRQLHLAREGQFLVHLLLAILQRLRVLLQLLGLAMLLGHVARDAARADDRAGAIAQRHLGRRNPGDTAIAQVLAFEFGDDRLAGPEHLLFIGKGLLGVLGQEEIEVGLAQDFGIVIDVMKFPQRLVDEKEPAVAILEVDAVGRGVHERHEQVMIDGSHGRIKWVQPGNSLALMKPGRRYH
jgi:hypothetical protein